ITHFQHRQLRRERYSHASSLKRGKVSRPTRLSRGLHERGSFRPGSVIKSADVVADAPLVRDE
ncbi:hypothetical protein F442_03312, partial [Phytophthora nicotianae P10297]